MYVEAIQKLQVGPQNPVDGSFTQGRAGRGGEIITGTLHGRYVEQMTRGNLFMGTGAEAGIAIINAAITGGHPTLWNPAGSGVILSLVSLTLSTASTDPTTDMMGWYLTANAGSAIGTAAPIVTFTNVAPLPCLIGGTATSKAKWAPTVNTFVAAPVYHMPTPFGTYDAGTQTSDCKVTYAKVEYSGEIGLAPGNAISLCNIAASGTLFCVGLVWEEIPL